MLRERSADVRVSGREPTDLSSPPGRAAPFLPSFGRTTSLPPIWKPSDWRNSSYPVLRGINHRWGDPTRQPWLFKMITCQYFSVVYVRLTYFSLPNSFLPHGVLCEFCPGAGELERANRRGLFCQWIRDAQGWMNILPSNAQSWLHPSEQLTLRERLFSLLVGYKEPCMCPAPCWRPGMPLSGGRSPCPPRSHCLWEMQVQTDRQSWGRTTSTTGKWECS